MLDLTHLARIVHGQLGLATAIALLHPVVVLRKHDGRWACGLACALSLTTISVGWLLYPGYRAVERAQLWQSAPRVAAMFETKEHLAFYVGVLAISGWTLARAGARPQARACFAAASALAFAVGALGAIVASAR